MAKRSSRDAQQPMDGGRAKKMKSKQRALSSSTFGFLPDDLVGEVLLRLPSKSLARFRCVCRSWARIICSPGFAGKHHALAAAKRPTMFVVAPMAPPHSWVLPDGGGDLNIPCGECPRIIGPKPCRGLVLLGRRCTSTYSVCNPSTGGILHLPPCLAGYSYYGSTAGIGFHEPAGEFKVVVIGAPTEPQPFRCEVVTVGDPAGWRAPAGTLDPAFQVQAMDPVLADGYLHWVLGRSSPHVKHHAVLSFSLATESFRTTSLPQFAMDDIRRCHLHESDLYGENPRRPGYITCTTPLGPVLAELDGRLCMARDLRHRDDTNSTLEIWKLRDYESAEWSLDYRVELAHQPVAKQQLLMTTWLVKPICYLPGEESCRKIMLATTMHKVHVYDPKTHELETVASLVNGQSYTEPYVGSPRPVNFLRMVTFQESLAHVSGMQYGSREIEYFLV